MVSSAFLARALAAAATLISLAAAYPGVDPVNNRRGGHKYSSYNGTLLSRGTIPFTAPVTAGKACTTSTDCGVDAPTCEFPFLFQPAPYNQPQRICMKSPVYNTCSADSECTTNNCASYGRCSPDDGGCTANFCPQVPTNTMHCKYDIDCDGRGRCGTSRDVRTHVHVDHRHVHVDHRHVHNGDIDADQHEHVQHYYSYHHYRHRHNNDNVNNNSNSDVNKLVLDCHKHDHVELNYDLVFVEQHYHDAELHKYVVEQHDRNTKHHEHEHEHERLLFDDYLEACYDVGYDHVFVHDDLEANNYKHKYQCVDDDDNLETCHDVSHCHVFVHDLEASNYKYKHEHEHVDFDVDIKTCHDVKVVHEFQLHDDNNYTQGKHDFEGEHLVVCHDFEGHDQLGHDHFEDINDLEGRHHFIHDDHANEYKDIEQRNHVQAQQHQHQSYHYHVFHHYQGKHDHIQAHQHDQHHLKVHQYIDGDSFAKRRRVWLKFVMPVRLLPR
ncbi:unnamed protein product [Tilletia caries]|nr:unnamed protein product [Tilletia caries]